MTSKKANDGISDPVRSIVEAMVHQALARCDREGIASEDFYRALMEEKKLYPNGTLTGLFKRIFRRLNGEGRS